MAFFAGNVMMHSNPLPNFPISNARSHFLNNPCNFMPENSWRLKQPVLYFFNVSRADPAHSNLDKNLPLSYPGLLNLLTIDFIAPMINGSLHQKTSVHFLQYPVERNLKPGSIFFRIFLHFL